MLVAPATHIRPIRTDWFVWDNPPIEWRTQYGRHPGMYWTVNPAGVFRVKFHRSHTPLLPPSVVASLGAGAPLSAGVLLGSVPGVTLRPYQAADLPYLLSRQGVLLAYEMRLGKTALTCHAHDPKDGSLVIVGPLASRDVWVSWVERVHGFRPLVLTGTQDIANTALPLGYPAYFVHFDVVDAWTRFLCATGQTIATLVLDEVHAMQNRKAKRTSAVVVLAGRAERIIGLTGTPMWSKPDSLYALLNLICPGAWDTHFNFAKHYCDAQPGAHGWQYNGLSNADEFAARLQHIMLRRTWHDVAPQLPPTTRVIEPVAVPPSKLASVESAAMLACLARGTNTVAGYLATLRRKLASLKIKAAVDGVEHALANGHPKVVLWTWHTEVADAVAAEIARRVLPGFETYRYRTGSDVDQITMFTATPNPCAIIASIAAGGVAIDLSASDYAIFVELDWIPAYVLQAEMRTFSPARPHVVVYLYADTLIETKLIEALGVKEDFQRSLGLGFDAIAAQVLGT